MRLKSLLLITAAMVMAATLSSTSESKDGTEVAPAPPEGLSVATFAGGCFWCMEKPFEVIDGVKAVTSGYIGGHVKNPTYKEVCTGETGHAEAIQILFDPQVVKYEALLEVYWRNIDPTTPDRQFCDYGFQYRPEIFYHGEAQLLAAETAKQELIASKKVAKVEVRISPASVFYVAEEYHQDFYKTNPEHYQKYRTGCGRDRRLAELWGASEH